MQERRPLPKPDPSWFQYPQLASRGKDPCYRVPCSTMHPGTEALLQYFEYEHLPPYLRVISAEFCELAHSMAGALPENPETTVCLRKLLEAKDCAVRAMLPPPS